MTDGRPSPVLSIPSLRLIQRRKMNPPPHVTPLKSRGLLYLPPDLTLKTFHFAHTMYLRVSYDIIKGTVCRHRINRLVFLVDANYVLCEALVKHIPIISIRLNFQRVPSLRR